MSTWVKTAFDMCQLMEECRRLRDQQGAEVRMQEYDAVGIWQYEDRDPCSCKSYPGSTGCRPGHHPRQGIDKSCRGCIDGSDITLRRLNGGAREVWNQGEMAETMPVP